MVTLTGACVKFVLVAVGNDATVVQGKSPSVVEVR